MNKKILKIIGTFFAFGFLFILYFLYDKIPCFLTSIFSLTNKSILEHLKILFGSLICSGIMQKIIIISNKSKIDNICFSNFIGAIVSIPLFLLIYLPINSFLEINAFVITTIMVIIIILSEIISYIIMNKKDFRFENKTILFVIITYSIFTAINLLIN